MLIIFKSFIWMALASAAGKAEMVEYKDGKTVLEGFMAYPEDYDSAKLRPGIVITHQWMGLSEHEKAAARRLAKEGYIVLAADIYGKGAGPKSQQEAGKFAGLYKNDRALFREREKAAYEFLLKDKKVDKNKIVFMGYCFGGTGALEAARAGLPIVGAVSFHGGLASTTPADSHKIKAKVLVLHGAIDPNVPADEVRGFMDEMNQAKVDYQFISYSGAVHAFTQKKEAGSDISKGVAYNEAADRRSWKALMSFLAEVAPLK